MSDEVRAWVDAGLYDPDAPDADERLELLKYLTEKGATFDDLVRSEEARSINAAASDRLLAPAKTLTRSEAATRVGLTTEQIDRAWLSVGLPAVPDSGPAFSEADMALLAAFAVGADLFGVDATLQLTLRDGLLAGPYRRRCRVGVPPQRRRSLGRRAQPAGGTGPSELRGDRDPAVVARCVRTDLPAPCGAGHDAYADDASTRR